MKKISSKTIVSKLTRMAKKQGIILQENGPAYKKGREVISKTVKVTNAGIGMVDTVTQRGEKFIEQAKAKIHAATAPKK